MNTHKEDKPAIASDAAMKIILTASPVGIVVFDHDARVLYTNPLADTIFSMKPDKAAGMRCGDFIRCAHRGLSSQGCGHGKNCRKCPLLGAICDACSQNASSQTLAGEAFLERGPDLPGIWVKYRVVGMVINGGRAAVMAVDDITAQKKDEEKLHNLMVELSAIHDHAPIAMMLLDRDRRGRKANGFAARFAQRTADEMTGLTGGEALRCLHHLDDPKGCGFGPACARCHVRQAVLDTFENGVSRTEVAAWLPFPKGDSVEERCLLISTVFYRSAKQNGSWSVPRISPSGSGPKKRCGKVKKNFAWHFIQVRIPSISTGLRTAYTSISMKGSPRSWGIRTRKPWENPPLTSTSGLIPKTEDVWLKA
jgi:PAS domain-containing protein